MSEQRRYYRKNLRLAGYLVREGKEREFRILDLSLLGIRAHFEDDPGLIVGAEAHIRLPGLKLVGDVIPVRVRSADEGGYDVGFDFTAMDGVEGNTYHYRAEEDAGEAYDDS